MTVQVDHIEALEGGIIKLLRFPDNPDKLYDLNLLTPTELVAFEGFKSDKRRAEFYFTRVLWKTFDSSESIAYDPLGRPCLAKGYISISHSRDLVVIAYHETHPVGVDVEYLSPKIRTIQSKFISSADEQLIDLSSDLDLTIVWSIKEAVYKMERLEGLRFREDIHVTIGQNEALVDVQKGSERHRYSFRFVDYQRFVITYCSHANLNGKVLF